MYCTFEDVKSKSLWICPRSVTQLLAGPLGIQTSSLIHLGQQNMTASTMHLGNFDSFWVTQECVLTSELLLNLDWLVPPSTESPIHFIGTHWRERTSFGLDLGYWARHFQTSFQTFSDLIHCCWVYIKDYCFSHAFNQKW